MNSSEKRSSSSSKRTSYLFLILQLILSVAMVIMIGRLDMLPSIYLAALAGGLLLLEGISFLLVKWKGSRIIGYIFSAIISIALIAGGYYVYKTSHMLDDITGGNEEITNVNVYVRAEDKAETINDAEEYIFGILSQNNRENTDETIEKINNKLKAEINIKEYDSITELINDLLAQKIGAMILSEGDISLIKELEGYENVEDKIKALTTFEIVTEVEKPKDKNLTKDPFIVYITGIDTTGSVSTRSRSDVNILMVVNPVTKNILLLSTPRDYYVPLSISNGVKDKLTHAGLYGVQVSMETLEMLYDIDIDHYVRLNFTGFVKVVDSLGGVNVYSDYNFSAGGYSYSKGYNALDGDAALAFARERYSFAGGDRQRGKNQMAVITAVINKLTSTAILNNYTSLLSGISNSVQTSISTDDIGSLIKMQLKDMSGWTVSSYSVDGTGASSYTYSMPKFKAYVMIPDEAIVNTAKSKINQIINGESLE